MKISRFKTRLTAAVATVALTAGLGALPLTAEAGGGGGGHRSFSHKCGSCGGSIYKKKVLVRRDRCGRPVFRWVRITHRCAPVRRPAPAPPPRCSHPSHRGGGGYASHRSIHPAEIIVPILNFIASQQQPRPPSVPVSVPVPREPDISRDPYGFTPYGTGKSGAPYHHNSRSGSVSGPTREYRY